MSGVRKQARQVSVHMDIELIAQLDAIAAAAGSSRSLLVERAVQMWIARQTAKRRPRRSAVPEDF